jgi:hypothetical protein
VADVKILLAALDAIVAAPDLRPEYASDATVLRTFCNLGAQRAAKAVGCDELDLPNVEENADFLYAIMDTNAKRTWARVDRGAAVAHALKGGLAFAALTAKHLGAKHGHLAAVRPERMRMSASAGGDVPVLANVGVGDPTAPLVPLRGKIWTRPNWNCRESEAFPVKRVGPAVYFAWRPA